MMMWTTELKELNCLASGDARKWKSENMHDTKK